MIDPTLPPPVTRALEAIRETSAYLWDKGWAERNAGNISHNLTDVWTSETSGPLVPYPRIPPEAEGLVLFITGTGKRLRELRDPGQAGAIVRFRPNLGGYELLWGGAGDSGFRITSEAASHWGLHLDLVRRQSPHRCIVHTHPLALIALSHHPEIGHDEARFTKLIWQMLPEVRAFVPRGVGIVPYVLPGSEDLGSRTIESLRDFDVALWSLHGATASGRDALEAFDFIDVADKGARLYLDCLAAGFEPIGLSQENLDGLSEAFGLPTNPKLKK